MLGKIGIFRKALLRVQTQGLNLSGVSTVRLLLASIQRKDFQLKIASASARLDGLLRDCKCSGLMKGIEYEITITAYISFEFFQRETIR